MPVSLNATAAAQANWFDRPVKQQLLAMPAAQRDAAALGLETASVHGLGPGSQNTLAEALHVAAPTVSDYLAFMGRPSAAQDLQAAASTRRVGGNVVGIMIARFRELQASGNGG